MQYRPPGDIYGPQTGGSVTGGGLYSGGGFTAYPTMTASTGGGFSFRKRSDRVDWKKIGECRLQFSDSGAPCCCHVPGLFSAMLYGDKSLIDTADSDKAMPREGRKCSFFE